jgi:hypothetical protein
MTNNLISRSIVVLKERKIILKENLNVPDVMIVYLQLTIFTICLNITFQKTGYSQIIHVTISINLLH